MEDNILKVENIEFKYPDGYKAIDNISFDIKKGEKVGIIGANGSGKSTIFKLLVGLQLVSNGKIFINNVEVKKNNLKEIRRKIGLVFQESDNQLFMNTVYDDITFGLRSYNIGNEEIKERIDNILNKMCINDLRDKKIYKLSGGEKKAVSIAGIMVMRPSIILMDEPTNTLDPKARRRVIGLIKDIEETSIIASHDLEMILECCDKVLVLNKGRIVAKGHTREILKDSYLMEESELEVPISLKR